LSLFTVTSWLVAQGTQPFQLRLHEIRLLLRGVHLRLQAS
jgi:hypothetical protein